MTDIEENERNMMPAVHFLISSSGFAPKPFTIVNSQNIQLLTTVTWFKVTNSQSIPTTNPSCTASLKLSGVKLLCPVAL